ncbi:Nucleoside-specific channel-forming protein Tsx [Klebsiella pneumoniae subsp. pneumoniae]|nr:Nucleoside-specific channel-forming protein Tsx [Klebsiella pneumoniae subsp. pneumoniae]
MKKTLLAAGAVVALSTTFAAGAAENDKPQYLSDWWHQSVNVVGSYHTRFGPQIRNDTYLEYEAFAKKDWFDFYGYIDAPVFFGGNSTAKGIWNKGSPLFMEIEPRFSIDKLTNTDLSFGPFKNGISPTTISTIWAATTPRSRAPGIWVWVPISIPACQ